MAGNWSGPDGVFQATGSTINYLGNDFDFSLQPSQEEGITPSSISSSMTEQLSSARRPSSARVEQAFQYLDNI